MKSINKLNNRIRRKKRVRSKVSGTSDRPRLSVFRSNKHIYAQIINDSKGETLVSASDFDLDKTENKKTGANKKLKKSESIKKNLTTSALSKKVMAEKVGEELAKKSTKKKVKLVVFDKSGYRYHGIVKALAEAARKGGLEF